MPSPLVIFDPALEPIATLLLQSSIALDIALSPIAILSAERVLAHVPPPAFIPIKIFFILAKEPIPSPAKEPIAILPAALSWLRFPNAP